MKGIVTVKKVFSDGREELVTHDDNVISAGLAESFVNLFTDNLWGGTPQVLAGYFQVGDGNLNIEGVDPAMRKYVYSLANPFLTRDYGLSTTSIVDVHNQVYGSKGNFVSDSPNINLLGTFVDLPDEWSTKITEDAVHYRLNIDKGMANGKTISEFGLFSRNPANSKPERSVMVAYKALDTPIAKNELFSVVIDWQLKFISETEEISDNRPFGDGGGEANGEGLNVVVIMADDLAIDQLGLYDDMNFYDLSSATNANAIPANSQEQPTNGSSIYPQVPCLSAMAAGGIMFKNAHANALCTATRANFLTGKNAFSSPQFEWLDDSGELLYKGNWGHGIATVATERPQRLRGGIKGLGRKYPFKNSENTLTYPELSILGGTNAEAGNAWYSSWGNTEFTVPNGYPNAGATVAPNFTVITDLLRDTNYAPSAYQSAMVGKWHLGEWEDLYVYKEDSTKIKGNGWKQIRTVGRFDKARAMFHNLNKTPIPGHNGDTPNLADKVTWTDGLGGDHLRYFDLSDVNMGYVNYFQYSYDDYTSDSSTLITVSDTGYTTFLHSASAQADGQTGDSLYTQGAASSYATNKTFSDASTLFNSMTEPFFMYLPLNTPHTPYTYPHTETVHSEFYNKNHVQRQYTSGVGNDMTDFSWINENAMIENMDHQLSAFLSSINSTRKDRTLFIFMGDNGADSSIMKSAYRYCSQQGHTASGIGKEYHMALYPDKMFGGTTSGSIDILGPGLEGQTQYLQVSAGRGGADNQAGRFKSSVYDRGTIIPFLVSGPFIPDSLQGSSTSAFVDVVDIYSTIAHVAGINWDLVPKTQKYYNDGFSFLPLLRGEVDASSHPRQFTFCEVFKPFGNSTGNVVNTGTETGTVLSYLRPDSDNYPYTEANNYGLESEAATSGLGEGGTGKNTIPFDRRRGYAIRQNKTDYGNQVIPDGIFNAAGLDAGTAVYGDIPEASAGVWKLIRPTSGPYFDELYHQRGTDFAAVDLLELVDQIPESIKGQTQNATTGLIVTELIKLAGAAGIASLTNRHWILARIYSKLSYSLSNYLRFRTPITTTVNMIYEDQPEAAVKGSIATTSKTAGDSEGKGEI
tara:strand:+ start:3694 stop:6951 length:3258 start_codon:yes stop_codon:yes gene_type:complete